MQASESLVPSVHSDNGSTHHSGLRNFLLILAVLLVAAGGVFAYQKFYRQPAPQEMWDRVSENLSSIKTMSYQGTVSIVSHREKTTVSYFGFDDEEPTEIAANTSTMNFQFSGASDWRDSGSPKGSLVVSADISPDPDLTMKLGFETRTMDDVIYAKLTAVPLLGMFDLGSFKDMWIRVNLKELQQKYGGQLAAITPAATVASSSDELTTDQMRQIREAFFNEQVIRVIGKPSSDTIGGAPMHRLVYVIEPEALLEFVSTSFGIVYPQNSAMAATLGIEPDSVREIVGPIRGQMWVGKNNLLPYKFTMSAEVHSPAMGFATSTSYVNIEVAMSNFNQPVTIEVPADTTSLDELMASFMGGLSSDFTATSTATSGSFATDDSGDTDNDGLTNFEEEFLYGTNPTVVDTDADTYPDGEEVKNGYNPNGPGKMPR